MPLLSLPYSTKLTQAKYSRINFKSSFSLQGTGKWWNGKQLHFLSYSVSFRYFSPFSFPPIVSSFPCTISISSQAYKLRLYLDTQKYISSPNSLYWELQVLVSNLQGISSFLCAKWNPQQWSTTPLLALSGITAHSFLNPKRRFFSLDLLFSLTSTLYSLWWEGLTILLQNIHQIHSSQENGSLSIGLFYINFMTKLLLLSSF